MTLIARGEFSIVIANLGATLVDGAELGALAAAFVLITAVVGPIAARFADRAQHRATTLVERSCTTRQGRRTGLKRG